MGWEASGKTEALRVEREMLCASHLVMDKRALIMTVDDTYVLHHHCQPSRGGLAIFFFFFFKQLGTNTKAKKGKGVRR